ncbi:MAG: 50S ribosomal protein L13 [Bacillota bacterium]|jgi:large subunit ribosomal protein L13
MRTYMAKAQEVDRKWYILDAANKPLGRVATEAARMLRGKHKPTFTPHVDTGDYVIVINADKVVLTGKKMEQKFNYRHSGFPGGMTATPYSEMIAKKPELTMELAVKGMLPKNRLGRKMLKKLKVYAGTEHKHEAQKPEVWNF